MNKKTNTDNNKYLAEEYYKRILSNELFSVTEVIDEGDQIFDSNGNYSYSFDLRTEHNNQVFNLQNSIKSFSNNSNRV